MKDKINTWEQKAKILEEVKPRSYTIQTEDGAILRRNRRDLLGPETTASRTDATEQVQHTQESNI